LYLLGDQPERRKTSERLIITNPGLSRPGQSEAPGPSTALAAS